MIAQASGILVTDFRQTARRGATDIDRADAARAAEGDVQAFERRYTGPPVRGDASFGTWVYRLALNVAVERRRSEASRLAGYHEEPDAAVRLSVLSGRRVGRWKPIRATCI